MTRLVPVLILSLVSVCLMALHTEPAASQTISGKLTSADGQSLNTAKTTLSLGYQF
jgi:hypothetical protein